MLDYFYYHEHLVLVTELLLENLYEWQSFVATSAEESTYFTLPVVQKIAKQVRFLVFFKPFVCMSADIYAPRRAEDRQAGPCTGVSLFLVFFWFRVHVC